MNGLLLCARYSVAPNFFGFCGPNKNKVLIDHLRDNIADKEISYILKEFETLYPYLQLIAYSNKIEDPFNQQVVEAYWIGNSYLKNVYPLYRSFLNEKLNIDKRIFPLPILPHHNFHVFNIFKRVGNVKAKHSLQTMNNCMINFGQIMNRKIIQSSKFRIQNYNSKLKMEKIFVRFKPLVMINHKLKFGNYSIKEVRLDYKGKIYIKNLKVGNYVSFHWGMICDKLLETQVKNLEYFTRQAINYFNYQNLIN